jgi:hypothetical protein
LFQFISRTPKHGVGYAKSKDGIGLIEQGFNFGIGVVQVFAHSGELGSLTGKYIGFHRGFVLGQKDKQAKASRPTVSG